MIRWYKIDVMVESHGKPPFFMGSMLRGALGFSLKRTVCINPTYQCEGCFAEKECIYYQFYEEKNVFHKFRLGIELQQKSFDYSLYLFEEDKEVLSDILIAIQKAAEEEGYGKERKKMKIRQMSVTNNIVYDSSGFKSLDALVPNTLNIDTFCPNVVLEFNMPLRIKENNSLAMKSIALHTLVNNIHHRLSQLNGEAPSRLNYRVEGEIVLSHLNFVEMKRYSNRQDKGMNMGGLKGILSIEGLDEKSYVYLKIGEIIGVGKQTVFGLGSYTIKEQK
ncbi:MAG: CRISPR system precrRNA processing endoribonuclease RAMP protein Cas6 [Sulfurovum sp.]|nr:CRISPR system precrRNA processing endoribonuclease RAMP protein Cas6 [Sulfurovum sp.]